MGGARRVIQTREEVRGGSLWSIIGSIVVALMLLTPLVWLTVEAGRLAKVFGDSGIVWVYASLLVLFLAGGVWFVFRVVRARSRPDQP